ncbi:MAG: hypothetical protein M3Z10_02715 [Gemmatimonadota bacterium]|nr:hypothetical protein [Gemmatimonadota bacterium]
MQMNIWKRLTTAGALALTTVAALGAPPAADAQWSRTYEQFYLPGSFNWTFRREYAPADRLFNAFDYGHAILYERLYTKPDAPVSLLETDEYDFITQKLLVSPPDLPLEEAAIEINYAKLAPEAKMMFDWAHLLHRQIYDVLASENMTQAEKDAKVAELVAYYKTRPDLAFSSVPKNMDLMEGQPYSLAFRQKYPKFNGLIWGYHWLQVGLYEPLMVGKSREERQAGVTAAVARFRQMLENAPEHMPRIMPMTAAISPTFAARYQEAAIIFDNLHAMHDVVSDILTNNEKVPHGQKRAAILEAASRYRDATSFPMSIAEWKSMGEMMGVANMGGPAVGFLPGWPTPTIARGASMAEAMKGMSGMQHGASGTMPGMPAMVHGDSSALKMPGMAHGDSAAMKGSMPGMTHGTTSTTDSPAAMDPELMELHERMLRDPVIRQRVMADTAMRRMMEQMDSAHAGMQHDMNMTMPSKAPAHNMSNMSNMAGMKQPATARVSKAPKPTSARKPTTVKKAAVAKKSAPKALAPNAPAPKKSAPPKPAPMDHSKMPGMTMPGMND